jgi:hypothetical protein
MPVKDLFYNTGEGKQLCIPTAWMIIPPFPIICPPPEGAG